MKSVNQNSDTSIKVKLLLPDDPPYSPSPAQQRNRTLIRIFFILVILLAFTAGAVLLFLLHENVTRTPPFQLVDKSIRIFCSETRFVPACLSSIGAKISPDRQKKTYGDDIFAAALQLVFEELVNLTVLTQSSITDSPESGVFKCRSLIHESMEKINQSLQIAAHCKIFSRRIDLDPGDEMPREMLAYDQKKEMLPKVHDSVTSLKNCYDALAEGFEPIAVEEARRRVHKAMVYATVVHDFLTKGEVIVVQLEELNAKLDGPRLNYAYLSILLMFCPQYLVLILMFCLLVRRV